MKVNFAQALTTLDGSPLTVASQRCPTCGQATEERAITLLSVCTDALLAQYPDERLQGTEKARRYRLALRLSEGEVDLKVEDVALLKDLVGKSFGPLVVGQVWDILDPAEECDG